MKTLAIEREFGSGGREIGRRVAGKAGIPFYDGELLIKEAERRGVSLDLLKEYDEKKTGSILYNIALLANYGQDMKQDRIYEMCERLQDTIRDLAMQGPAVFIGRCSTEILKGEKTVGAFLYCSDEKQRVARVVRTEKVSESEARKLMERRDRQRKDYFKFWAQKNWADRKNYDLELNTGTLSPEACEAILLQAIGYEK
ncbi:MAG: cytidylate kinase-like family protein [Eubacteriales bacterium]|nr:cytidylate kinase-like family protein [Eubacteriales bacterium]